MRGAWVLFVVAGVGACDKRDEHASAPAPPAALSAGQISAIAPPTVLERLGRLAAGLGHAPPCAAVAAGLAAGPRPAELATLTSADGARRLHAGFARAADALARTADADLDRARATRELAASLRDLSEAFAALAAITSGPPAADAARALATRIDNGVGNAEISVAAIVARCAP